MTSRYSGKSSLRIDEVAQARMLSPGVSPEEKRAVQEHLDAANLEVQVLEPEVNEATAAIDKIGTEGQAAQSKLKDATQAISERVSLEQKVERCREQLQEAQKVLSRGDHNEKKNLVKSLKSHISQYIGSLESSSLHCDEWMKANLTLVGVKLNEEVMFEKKSKLE